MGITELNMFKEKIKQSVTETFKLLWQFKWYILPYIAFYIVLISFYLSPSPKQYNIWMNKEWFVYDKSIYLALTKLMLVIFALFFLLGQAICAIIRCWQRLYFFLHYILLPSF